MMAKTKVNVTIDEELLSRIDEYAEANYTTRSAVITIASNQFLLQNEAIRALVTMSVAMDRVSKTGVLDEQTKQEFEDFGRIAALMMGK